MKAGNGIKFNIIMFNTRLTRINNFKWGIFKIRIDKTHTGFAYEQYKQQNE